MIANRIFNMGAGIIGVFILLHAGSDQVLKISSPLVRDVPVRKVVIFDIGGILAAYSTSRVGVAIFKDAVKDLGFFKIVKYAAAHKNCTSRLRSLVFRVLEEISSLHPLTPEEYVALQIYDEEGNAHPKGICLLHAGRISSEEFVRGACHIIATWWQEDQRYCKDQRVHFTCAAEVALVRSTIMRIGNGAMMAKIFKPIQEGVALLKKVMNIPDIEVMILSNYPTDQFEALISGSFLKKFFAEIPRDHIFCSGQLLSADSQNCLSSRLLKPKPHPAAFTEMILYCQMMYGVQPQDIIFLDNQEENVRAALAQGIDARLVNSVNEESDLHQYTFAEINDLIDSQLSLAESVAGSNV